MASLLDPLFAAFARLAVAQGIMFPDLVDRLKPHVLKAAHDMTTGKVTDSRLSVMTGLQRRDIARLQNETVETPRQNHLTRLVALWRTEPGYCDASGPLVLPRNGPAPSFETLAWLVRRDVHPRTMLDTLAEAGTVAVSPQGDRVTLVQMSYQPLSGSEDQLAYLAWNIADHLDAATENVRGQVPAHFERAVHYSDLTAEQMDALRAEYHKLQMHVFETLSIKAAHMKKTAPKGADCRFRAGGYFYQTTKDTE